MTPIDPAQQLASLIRVQVASLRRRQAPSGKAAAAPRDAGTTSRADPPPDLAQGVASRIRALARDDPQRERKAFRLFLESVLLAELGPALVNDASFTTLVDHVQQQMESDADLAQAARDAAQVLLKNADAAGA